jgi:hypothetical protein
VVARAGDQLQTTDLQRTFPGHFIEPLIQINGDEEPRLLMTIPGNCSIVNEKDTGRSR